MCGNRAIEDLISPFRGLHEFFMRHPLGGLADHLPHRFQQFFFGGLLRAGWHGCDG
jgi:hypothetical protein